MNYASNNDNAGPKRPVTGLEFRRACFRRTHSGGVRRGTRARRSKYSHQDVGNFTADLQAYKRVLVYCRSGKRAQIASAALEKAGLKTIFCVANGGWLDWQ